MLKNILANIFGRFWTVSCNLISIHLYIKYLGFENYSFLSIIIIFGGILSFFDAGLTATLSREFARQDQDISRKIAVFKNVESFYILALISMLGVLFLFSKYIASYLLNESYGINSSYIIKIAIFEILIQMLFRLYMGGLFGLKYHIQANVTQSLWIFFRNIAVVFLIMIHPKIEYFLVWQALVTFIFAIITRIQLTMNLSGIIFERIQFGINKNIFKSIGNFTFGMFLISFVAMLNTQFDKIIIAKLLDNHELGFYTLAVTLASGIISIISPLATSVQPILTSLFSIRSHDEAIHLFKKISLIKSLLIITISCPLSLFSYEFILAWTDNIYISENTSSLLRILVIGYGAIGLQILSFNVALANGYTLLNNIIGISSLFITIPGYWLSGKKWQSDGVVFVFVVTQLLSAVIINYFVNKKFLNIKNYRNFLFLTFIRPLLFTFTIFYILRQILYKYTLTEFNLLCTVLFTYIIVIASQFCIYFKKSDIKYFKSLI